MAKTIDVLRRFLPTHLRSRPALDPAKRRAIWAITHCRTATMGGHLYACSQCGDKSFAYHSCNHKACPQCGRDTTRKWVERELGKRVGAPYFMVTFTLPSELRGLFFGKLAKEAFDLFFCASSAALREKLATQKGLAAVISGFTGVLHTWNQLLLFHPHIHYIVPGAGINAQGDVVQVKNANFLLHLPVLQKAFRYHFRRLLELNEWEVDPVVWNKDWGINIAPFGTGENVIKYLGAYVARTAIGDARILSMDEHNVSFQWKDRANHDQRKIATITGVEFVKRYLRHVLPRGLRSIRYFGFCHPAAKKKRERIAFHTGMTLVVGPPVIAAKDEALGVPTCSCCDKPMLRIASFRPKWLARPPPSTAKSNPQIMTTP